MRRGRRGSNRTRDRREGALGHTSGSDTTWRRETVATPRTLGIDWAALRCPIGQSRRGGELSQGKVTSQSAPPRLYFCVPPEPSHLLRARERLRDYLRQYCADGRVVDDVVLCVEEAASNAVRHSGSEHDIEISLRSMSTAAGRRGQRSGPGLRPRGLRPERNARPVKRPRPWPVYSRQPHGLPRAASGRRSGGAHGATRCTVRRACAVRQQPRRCAHRQPHRQPSHARRARGDRRGLRRVGLGVPLHSLERSDAAPHGQVARQGAREGDLGALPGTGRHPGA